MKIKPEKIRFRPPKLTILLILLVYLYLTFSWAGYWNTNEYSRIFLVRALIDHHKFAIDDIIVSHDTQDKSFFRGHYYSNKAPGVSFIATPVYLLVRLLEIYTRLVLSEEAVLYFVKAICISLPSAFFLVLLFKFWAYITLLYPVRRALLIAYALGTLVWPYSTLFYGHQLATISLFLAFLIIFVSREMKAVSKPMFEAGFFCGVAFCIEYPTLLITFLLFVYATVVFKNVKGVVYLIIAAGLTWLLQDRFEFLVAFLGDEGALAAIVTSGVIALLIIFWQTPALFFFLLGLLLPVAATLFYHKSCFGGVFQFPYYFETYQPFAVAHREGIAGVILPESMAEFRGQLSALGQLLISPYRGLFFYSPFLLFSFSGIFKMIWDREWRKEGWLFFGILVIYFLFLSAFSDWEGGWSMGPRHLTPLMPFLVTAVVFQMGKIDNSGRSRLVWVLAPLILLSTFFMFLGTSVFPYFPKEFKNPLYELSWTVLNQKQFAPTIGDWLGLTGLMRLIPLIVILGGLVVILFLDLSWICSRNALGRAGFSVVCALIVVSLLFLGVIGSLWRETRLTKRDIVLREYQGRRINSFIQAGPAKKM